MYYAHGCSLCFRSFKCKLANFSMLGDFIIPQKGTSSALDYKPQFYIQLDYKEDLRSSNSSNLGAKKTGRSSSKCGACLTTFDTPGTYALV